MGQFETGPHGARYSPKLGGCGMFDHTLSVDQWLKETVFILHPDTWVSREAVVLNAADKDGGAHVDAQLTPLYERLVAVTCFSKSSGCCLLVSSLTAY